LALSYYFVGAGLYYPQSEAERGLTERHNPLPVSSLAKIIHPKRIKPTYEA
jgi:hypothetical protein